MLDTKWQKGYRAFRKECKQMESNGYERLDESGGKLWELNRGYRIGMRIVDAVISGNGQFVWVKVEGVSDLT